MLCLLLLSASKSVDSNAVLDKTMQTGATMADTYTYDDIPAEIIESWCEEAEAEEAYQAELYKDYPTDEEITEILSEIYRSEQNDSDRN